MILILPLNRFTIYGGLIETSEEKLSERERHLDCFLKKKIIKRFLMHACKSKFLRLLYCYYLPLILLGLHDSPLLIVIEGKDSLLEKVF